jgi:hypothetical protein
MAVGSEVMRVRTDCEVRGAYKQIDTPVGTLASSYSSEPQEITLLLVPTKLDKGAYSVNVTRKAANLYAVDGTQVYLVTRYCYEYSYSQKAFLDFKYSSGTLTFGH